MVYEIELMGWYWLCRIRGGKSVKLSEASEWKTVKELIPEIKSKTTHYEKALLTKEHERTCRMVTTHRKPKGRKVKTSRGKTTSTVSNGSFSQSNKEPWILATNLPLDVTPVDIVNLYFKRMQIEIYQSYYLRKSEMYINEPLLLVNDKSIALVDPLKIVA
jgi:hypothetical protein